MKNLVHKVVNNWEIMPGGVTWYLIGPPKSGKTTAASRWSEKGTDGVIVLDTDLGADFVHGANIIPITSLAPPMRVKLDENGKEVVETVNGKTDVVLELVPPDERGYCYRTGEMKGKPMDVYSLVEAVTWIKENWEKLPYDTIVIDTIDRVNEWIEDVISEKFGVEDVVEVAYGVASARSRKDATKSVERLQTFIKMKGATLLLTSHSTQSTTTDGKVQLSPELPRRLAQKLTAIADVIGYTTVRKTNGKHYVSFVAYDERSIGSRLKPLNQKELLLDFNVVVEEIKKYKEE